MELCLEMNEELTEILEVRITGRARTENTKVGVCYRQHSQEDQADEAPCRQIEATSRSQASVLMLDFNHTYICWRASTAGHMQSRRFLE